MPHDARVPALASASTAHADRADAPQELGRSTRTRSAARTRPTRPPAPRHPPQQLGRAICKCVLIAGSGQPAQMSTQIANLLEI